jgi:hypothetical protein
MLKQDARVALVATALPLVGCLPALADGSLQSLTSPEGTAGADAGGWRSAAGVSSLLAGAPVEVQARASALRINGVALQWRAVVAPQPPAQVGAALGVAWRAVEQEGAVAAPRGGAAWLVLTRRVGNELHALQLRGDGRGGSEGYWSVLDPTQPAGSRPRAPIAIPAGAAIESTIEQLDPALRSTQYVGRARQAAASLGPRLRRAALAAGWVEQAPGIGRAGFQAYARGDELLELQVLPDGDSAGFLLNVHAAAPGARPPGVR